MQGHISTSFGLPQQQSRHLSLIALIGVVLITSFHPFLERSDALGAGYSLPVKRAQHEAVFKLLDHSLEAIGKYAVAVVNPVCRSAVCHALTLRSLSVVLINHPMSIIARFYLV